jgi:hypothetical protein
MTNNEIYNHAKFQEAWDSLCDALQKIAILVEDYFYLGCGRKLQESDELSSKEIGEFEKKCTYLIQIINENIDTIIRCLGFDPHDNKDQSFIFKILSLKHFDPKKDLQRDLSKENLIKLQGKIQSVIHSFKWFLDTSHQEDPLYDLRVELQKALERFGLYIKTYNDINPGKEIATLLWCLEEWFRTDKSYKNEVLAQWNKDLKIKGGDA